MPTSHVPAWLKRGLDLCVRVLVAPYVAMFRLSRPLIGNERAYLAISERAARWPGVVGQRMRAAVHRGMGSDIGRHAVLSYGVVLERPPSRIGEMTMLGHYTHVQNADIGRDCLISDYVLIIDGTDQHGSARLDVPLNAQPGTLRRVTIGDDTLIGGHAWVAAPVGNHCIVGAGSVVTRSVPDYKIVVGVPARIVGDRRDRTAD